jgi:hypothetical protein
VLEADYRTSLVAALRDCASGRWGLFGHNDYLMPKSATAPAVDQLLDLGGEIEQLRARLNLEPFELHERLLVSRGSAAPNAPGEPKQAQAWLRELGEL